MAEIEKEAIEKTIKTCGGNLCKSALQLGIARYTLYRKAKKYGINLSSRRPRAGEVSQLTQHSTSPGTSLFPK